MGSEVVTQKSPENIVSAFTPDGKPSVDCFLALQHIDKFQCANLISELPKMSQNITKRRKEDHPHWLSGIDHQHAMGLGCPASNEDAIMQYQTLDVQCDKASAVGGVEPKRLMAGILRTAAQPLSSQSFEIFSPYRRSVDAYRVEKTSNAFTTLADAEEAGSLLVLTEETEFNLPSLFHVDHISPLLLWISHVSNDSMPMSERLEKSKWEVRRLERL